MFRKFRFLPAIMVAVVVAKWVGDWMNHSLYHALLHLKHIPYLGNPHKSLTLPGEITMTYVYHTYLLFAIEWILILTGCLTKAIQRIFYISHRQNGRNLHARVGKNSKIEGCISANNGRRSCTHFTLFIFWKSTLLAAW